MNIWKVIQNGNNMKRTGRDHDGRVTILPPTTVEEHIAVALNLKSKGGLEFLSFDDLYYKLKTFKVDVKGYITFSSSQYTGPSHSAFVSATSTSKKMSYGDSLNYSSTTTYSVPSNFKTGSHRSRRNLLGSTSRKSDATSVNKEATLLENTGQREEMTSRDISHSRLRILETRKKIQKP
nr:hypothetical protein [Tanacetum cinerariifolium]